MSALAQALLDHGESVTGSDRLLDHGDRTPTLARLEKQGVRLSRQDGSGITPDTARLVVSSAIERDNPEVVKAQALGVPEVHRAAELARTLSGHRLIAVAGTCGKSTVTAMLGHILAGSGFDPFVVNGAEIIGWDNGGTRIGSVREGKGVWAVAEVDESDKSLMAFAPEDAIITNASADHFGMNETQEVFEAFRKRVSGMVIDGRSEGVEPQGIVLAGWSGSFTLDGIRYTVPMPGRHNVMNAWHAVRMALAVGASPAKLVAALADFPGVARRLQRLGCCGDAVVIDDYAHNPEKLAAAWGTLAAAFPQGIAAVWRPHGFGPLRKMKDALSEVFSRVCRPQDALGILPVYDAGGTADRSYTSGEFVAELSEREIPATLLASLDDAETFLRAHSGKCGALVTFGARDPGLPRLAVSLASR